MTRVPTYRATLAALAAAALLAGPAHAQQREEFRWSGRVEAGRTLEVRGVNGRIRAERASGSEVEVLAVKSARRNNPAEVTIEVIPHAGGLTVCTLYPTPSGAARPNSCAPGASSMNVRNNDVQVDYTIRVPDGVRLLARTTNGEVEVTGLTADVDAATTNGGIRISTRGVARARTTNGSLDVTLGSTTTSEELDFRTTNGTITVTMPGNVNASFRATTTNGSISSDFPVTVQGTFGPRRLEGVIGSGGPSLTLQTTNGDVRLRRAGG